MNELFFDVDYKRFPKAFDPDREASVFKMFLNTRFGIFVMGRYEETRTRQWVDLAEFVYVSKEIVFENLSQEDKLVFAFNFVNLEGITDNKHAIKTSEEYERFKNHGKR